MDINVIKESFDDYVSVKIWCAGGGSTFIGVQSVCVGQRAGENVSFRLCDSHKYVGLLTLFAKEADVFIAECKAAGVFRDEDPFELSVAG